VIVRCRDPRVCPVRLLHSYLQRTEEQAQRFVQNRPTRDEGKPVPLFFYLRGEPKAFGLQTLQKTLSELFKEAGMKKDSMDRPIKPGSFRISARTVAEKAGFPLHLITAIGHWAAKSVERTHYTVYEVPDTWTDSILQPERINTAS
jgi:hypothetical protein